jgi:hypothetical protein
MLSKSLSAQLDWVLKKEGYSKLMVEIKAQTQKMNFFKNSKLNKLNSKHH